MIMDLFRVTGKVAVVTGAGRGLGAAAAVALAEAGADVVISARSADQLANATYRRQTSPTSMSSSLPSGSMTPSE